MKDSTGVSSEAPASWLSSLTSCYSPLIPCLKRDRRIVDEGSLSPAVVQKQPYLQPAPLAVSGVGAFEAGGKDGHGRKSPRSGRIGLSGRRKPSGSASRRPLISAPSNFRHLHSAPLEKPPDLHSSPWGEQHFAHDEPRPHHLEMSPCLPHTHVSPVLPHLNFCGAIISPPSTHCTSRADASHHALLHLRTEPFLSFHVPRRQLEEVSPATAALEMRPQIPPKAQGRVRASTGPEVDAIKARVAGAVIEVERLQRQIDDIVERQTLFANGRPSSPRPMGRAVPDCPFPTMTPMSSVPALPPAAPSFAERLHLDAERTLTAPKAFVTDARKSSDLVTSASPLSPRLFRDGRPSDPTASGNLRPPLRKKKSFTQVSDWLFPGSGQQQSGDRPGAEHSPGAPDAVDKVKGRPRRAATAGRQSCASFDSASTWETDEAGQTAPTTRSAESNAGAKQEHVAPLERSPPSGGTGGRRDRCRVGVAM